MGLWSWIKSKFSKPEIEMPKSGPFIDTKNHGRVFFPAKGKFVQESHYANNMERFANGLFPASSTEKIDIHLNNSFAQLKKYIPDAVFEKVYSDRYKRQWTPANDGSINEYGQAARGSIRPAPVEELWQGNMFFKELPHIGTKFLITAPNGKKCVIQMGYEIGPGGTKFLGGLTTEVHYYLGSDNDTILTIELCDQGLPLGPLKSVKETVPVKTNPETPGAKSPPWYLFAKKFEGKKETDPAFNKQMSAKWSLFGMNLGTIAQSWAAWCGLAMAVSLSGVGLDYARNGSLARNWASYGVAIDWKNQGIPQGAIVHINHSLNCNSSSSNHVAQANGDCTASDLVEMAKGADGVWRSTGKIKSGATIDLYGGNQGNTWKVSAYPVKEICAVRWPKDYEMPAKVIKSINCTSSKSGSESTR